MQESFNFQPFFLQHLAKTSMCCRHASDDIGGIDFPRHQFEIYRSRRNQTDVRYANGVLLLQVPRCMAKSKVCIP